jgi:hypothetical protein
MNKAQNSTFLIIKPVTGSYQEPLYSDSYPHILPLLHLNTSGIIFLGLPNGFPTKILYILPVPLSLK